MRLIDADKLRKDLMESKEKLWRLYKGLSHPVDKQICGGEIGTFTEVILRIDDAQTVDAVPVVRCKDCEHWRMTYKGNLVECHGYCHLEDADGIETSRWESDFCSYGERRSEP